MELPHAKTVKPSTGSGIPSSVPKKDRVPTSWLATVSIHVAAMANPTKASGAPTHSGGGFLSEHTKCKPNDRQHDPSRQSNNSGHSKPLPLLPLPSSSPSPSSSSPSFSSSLPSSSSPNAPSSSFSSSSWNSSSPRASPSSPSSPRARLTALTSVPATELGGDTEPNSFGRRVMPVVSAGFFEHKCGWWRIALVRNTRFFTPCSASEGLSNSPGRAPSGSSNCFNVLRTSRKSAPVESRNSEGALSVLAWEASTTAAADDADDAPEKCW
mmetsp:Transcript_13958/g.28608  ORF Transcript_13958/g.28608 Transcript_13958/m.28608 type:complete len:269 (+) Transcript_13958:536-1342(+)